MAAKILINMPGGREMPAIGLGTGGITNESDLKKALNTALEVGYRHIDTAFVYKSEVFIGQVLKEWFSSGKLKREDIFITTKLPQQGVHEDRVEMFLKKSLENLQLDYVDLYLIHFPIGFKNVEGDDVLETKTDHIAIWKKMEEQVYAGRTKAIGVSNFNIRQIERIIKSSRIKPACLQVEIHVNLQQQELVNFCHQNEIVVVAYSPLGCPGYNKYLKSIGLEPRKLPDMLHDPNIANIAKKHKKTNAQVMLLYILQKNIVAIPESITPSRIKENIDLFDFSLDSSDMKSLDGLEIGESARVWDAQPLKRFSDHPEWPYSK